MNKAVGITCGVVFAIGAVVTVAGLASANFNFGEVVRRDNYKTREKIAVIDAQNTVKINLTYGDIKVISDSEADNISVSYYTESEDDIQIKTTDIEISIKDKYNYSKNWYDIFQTATNLREITITIPEMEYKNLDVKITSGEVQLDNIQAENLSIKMTSGEMNGSNLKGDTFTINQTSGLLNIDKCDFDILHCDVTSGQTKITDATIANTNFNITSGSMKVYYTQLEKDFSVGVNITS